MKARAPGKLVLSGAYSILWGAPALVCAVSRYAIADTERAPEHVGAELGRAVELGYLPFAPHVDVSALRAPRAGGAETRKLGLGSSAALLVAALAAFERAPLDDARRARIFERARHAHREAQGGGSGVDVAAAVYGGVSLARLDAERGQLRTEPFTLPRELHIRVYAAAEPAETASLVARVRAYREAEPARFDELIGRARRGAEQASSAREALELASALDTQREALDELGTLAGVPIVTEAVRRLATHARALDAAHFGPSGAGGGDVALWVGASAPPPGFVALAEREGYLELALQVGAPGVELLPSPATSPLAPPPEDAGA